MSRHTSVAVEYSLFDRTASQDNAFSIDEIQPFSDTAELNDDEQRIEKWATMENTGFLMDGTFELPPDDLAAEFTVKGTQWGKRNVFLAAGFVDYLLGSAYLGRTDADLFRSY